MEHKTDIPLLRPRQRFSREEICARLRARTEKKEPILMAGAGIGIVAKMAEAGDLDLIAASSEDRFRMMGQPSALSYLAIGNANDLALDALKRAARMARRTPVLCGVTPGDPYREPEAFLETARTMGADGIIGQPAADGFGPRLDQDVAGSILHTEGDLHLLYLAREMGLFSAALAFRAAYAARAAAAGADLIVAHCGFTVGGLAGAPEDAARTLDEVCAFTEEVLTAVRRENPDAFVLCHGGPLNTPEAVQTVLDRTGVQGFYGGAAFDRIPMERAITQVVSQLESLELSKLGGAEA